MNNTFDFNRFSLLVKRQWVENKKLFLMGCFALIGFGVVLYSLTSNWDRGDISNAVQVLFFIGGLFIGGTYFTNYIFKDFSDKNSSTNFLMIPSSHLEKLLSGCFYSFIVFPALFLAVFFVTDYFFVGFANSFHQKLVLKNLLHDNSWKENTVFFDQLFEKPGSFLQPLIGTWFIAQSVAIIGTVKFTQWSYIKTVFISFAFIIALGFFVNFVFNIFLEDFDKKSTANIYAQIKPTKELLQEITIICLKYVFTPILLLIAYFKLKEKQV
jgi:hypothetical protein